MQEIRNSSSSNTNADALTFVFGEAGAAINIRAITDDKGAPWFIFNDIRSVLGLAKTGRTLGRLDDADKGVCQLLTPRGTQQVATVNEAGLYALIFRSRKTEALAFKRWVTSVVLPAIRLDGVYIRGEERLALADASREQLQAQLAGLQETMLKGLARKAERAGLCPVEEKEARYYGLRPNKRPAFSGRFGDPDE